MTIYTGNIPGNVYETDEDATPIKCESATARMPDYTIGQNGQATFKGRAI